MSLAQTIVKQSTIKTKKKRRYATANIILFFLEHKLAPDAGLLERHAARCTPVLHFQSASNGIAKETAFCTGTNRHFKENGYDNKFTSKRSLFAMSSAVCYAPAPILHPTPSTGQKESRKIVFTHIILTSAAVISLACCHPRKKEIETCLKTATKASDVKSINRVSAP